MRVLVNISYQGSQFLGFSNTTKWKNCTTVIRKNS
ncbi:Uncharacterised protein [Staphylococcus gallinarum]|uniref:Uncharacterized protein n=1 Tax=Staphylococcus gallinarum TaxID=1293 RepID=A0A380FM32_STAGA|nr:Uncharacterised protein [Staphylococcus gallinarum]